MLKVNKSEQIRMLHDQGMSLMEISTYMGIRYQFAYNVVSYYLKQKSMEVQKYVAAGNSSPDSHNDEANPSSASGGM